MLPMCLLRILPLEVDVRGLLRRCIGLSGGFRGAGKFLGAFAGRSGC